jgi:hypothetical protein
MGVVLSSEREVLEKRLRYQNFNLINISKVL